jgi:uracil-DNA glycosylase
VTVRRSRYRVLLSLQRDNRVCRACAEAGFPLESWPVLEGRPGQRAYILGQAPGSVEAVERRPWRGRAGQTLRQWLQLDEDSFYRLFYCASVMRCYPGRSPTGRGDRAPTPREQELCRFWREWEFRLLRPRLIVPVGILATRQLLGIRSLADCIGESFRVDEALAVPLPHPSGRNTWLNDRANRARLERATTRIRDELARLSVDAE